MKKVLICFIFYLFLLNTIVYAFSPSSEKIYSGIDVSEWQGNIDYEKVAESGVKIVYIKTSEGNNYIDPYFKENYKNARANGLKVGFYHFLTAKNIEEAKEQAEFFVSVIEGTQPECKLAMDFEDFEGLEIDEINDIAREFLEMVEELTKKEMVIYSDAYNAKNIFTKELSISYPIWVADYFVEEPENNGKWNSWVGFQYTDIGNIDGIRKNVDKNYFTGGILLNDISNIQSKRTQKVDLNTDNVIVEKGDTLSKIAEKYNTSYEYLAKINGIVNPNIIYIGQKISVPILGNNEKNDMGHQIYTVKSGDTLTQIAKKFEVSIENIVNLNDIKNADLIYTNQTLRIPTINKYY